MSRRDVINAFDQMQKRRELNCRIGDFVSVVLNVQDGSKKRAQHFDGIVVRIASPGSASCMLSVYRPTLGGCLRIFPLHSPSIHSITIKRSSKVRRSRLYFILGKVGKKARLPVANR